ncbi:MAG: hypothetical protein IJI27_08705 [Oscillospiraceae bacterium]|nr:hypothetical protein [Oscillospiraceae bacterium]
MKRLLASLLTAALLLTLCGCGSAFEKEYVSVVDYVPAAQEQSTGTEKIMVHNYNSLRSAVRSIVYAGAEEGTITFDQSYDGDSREDMAAVCAQMRTQDALFAYCVQNIGYEYSTIVAHDEATLHVHYADSTVRIDQIQRLSYSTGLEKILREAMEENRRSVGLLINVSSYSALQMKQLVADTYHASPLCAACEPDTDVHMYSGSGKQRLYEIVFDYGLPEDEIIRRKAQLLNLDVRSNIGAEGMDDAHAALAACRYLVDHCEVVGDEAAGTVYDALIMGAANSEGVALAYVEMCHQLGLECQIVYGQKTWTDHCWNILTLDGQRYHVDVGACAAEGMENAFLCSDDAFWNANLYRWNTAAYPSCTGELRYSDLIEEEQDEWMTPEEAEQDTPEEP